MSLRERRIVHWYAQLAFIAGLTLVFAACAGSGAEFSLVASEDIDRPMAALGDRAGLGYAFAGEEVTEGGPTLTVDAGEEVTVTLENKHGQYSPTTDSHDFAVVPVLDEIPTLAASGALEDEILWDSSIDRLFAGETGSVTFTPETPGNYYYLCTVPGHAQGGMIGKFVVERS